MHTQRYVSQTSGASLILLENDRIRVCDLDLRPDWLIGRYDPHAQHTGYPVQFRSCEPSAWLDTKYR